MRYDDRLATILNYPAQGSGAISAVWTQLVDLLAQRKASAADAPRAYERLGQWRAIVPERRRLAAAVAVAGRQLPFDLVQFFADDSPAVAAPVLVRARLKAVEWRSLIAQSGPAARALLRERRDLPEEARAALSAFGRSDFALPDHAVPPLEPRASTGVAIEDLVRRIESFKGRQSVERPEPARLASFAFETDADGLVCWVENVPRGAVIGISLAEMAPPGGMGVEGRACGAFRKRDSIRDARLCIGGTGPASGEWLISAQPFFDGLSGRFEGYRGIARRKPAAVAVEAGPVDGMTPGSARQLVHELRTPLNAIRGFAEMIEGQYLGPVEPGYRRRAETIILESERLLRIFDDLDISARMTSDRDSVYAPIEADMVRVMRATAGQHASLAGARSVQLKVALPAQPVMALVDEANLVRMIDRLLLCSLASAQSGEVVKASLKAGESGPTLDVALPSALQGLSHDQLLDPALGASGQPMNEDIPLGLAFVLRLVKRIARKTGSRFEIASDRFVLILPAAQDSSAETIESS